MGAILGWGVQGRSLRVRPFVWVPLEFEGDRPYLRLPLEESS